MGGGTRPSGEPRPQHPLRGAHAEGQGPSHPPRRRPGRDRRGGHAMSMEALLVLHDGTEFEGEAIGALRQEAMTVASGELVFNTALSGYQEIVTDPSYAGQ